jgi:hypothetical protein
MNPAYLDTARLLTQVVPLVFVDDTFALNGGTAIRREARVTAGGLLVGTGGYLIMKAGTYCVGWTVCASYSRLYVVK